MSKYRKGKLYIRRYRDGDSTSCIRTSFQMAFFKEFTNGTFYVVVRHGLDDGVISCEKSKFEAKQQFKPSFKYCSNLFKVEAES